VNYSQYGYGLMADFEKENTMGNNFIGARIFKVGLEKVDQIHYSASFSKLIAEVIVNQFVEKFNLGKRSNHPIVDHN
jgi:hypothetical protein